MNFPIVDRSNIPRNIELNKASLDAALELKIVMLQILIEMHKLIMLHKVKKRFTNHFYTL